MQLRASNPMLPDVSRLTTMIVDLDGTLADSNDAHTRAWVASLESEGLERQYDEVHALMGMGGDQLVPHLTGKSEDSELGQRLVNGWKQNFKTQIAEVQPLPAARELLKWAQSHGLKIVLASSGEDEIVDALLEQTGLSDLVPASARVRSSEVGATKPQPDVLQVALDKAGVPPQQALFVGDSIYDAEAAKRAGVPYVLLRAGGAQRLNTEEHVLSDARELLAALKGAAEGCAMD